MHPKNRFPSHPGEILEGAKRLYPAPALDAIDETTARPAGAEAPRNPRCGKRGLSLGSSA
jgi:hypothetical protein